MITFIKVETYIGVKPNEPLAKKTAVYINASIIKSLEPYEYDSNKVLIRDDQNFGFVADESQESLIERLRGSEQITILD